MSSSSSSSSSSSRSPSPSAPSMDIDASSSRSSRPQRPYDSTSSNHADSLSFIPPQNYLPSHFAPGAALTAEDLAAAQKSGKHLWSVKVPHGVRPALLQGLSVRLGAGRESEEGAEPLATIREGGEGKGDTYHLVEAAAGADATLRVYAPTGAKGRKDGTIAASPLPISRNFEFVLAPPAPSLASPSEAASTQAAAGQGKEESKHASSRPSSGSKLRELNGYFHPAGSLYDDEDGDEAPSKGDTAALSSKSKSKSKDKDTDSPSKSKSKDKSKDKSDESSKQKKRKKDEGEDSEGKGKGEDSPSKGKSKVRKSKS